MADSPLTYSLTHSLDLGWMAGAKMARSHTEGEASPPSFTPNILLLLLQGGGAWTPLIASHHGDSHGHGPTDSGALLPSLPPSLPSLVRIGSGHISSPLLSSPLQVEPITTTAKVANESLLHPVCSCEVERHTCL